MPQITKLVDLYVPKIQCETALDIGIGDGETIESIRPFFGNPLTVGCDPHKRDSSITTDYNPYENSLYFQQEFDLITLFDSLACWNKQIGRGILEHIELMSKKMVLIWTPEGYYPYKEDENPRGHFESCWHASELLDRGYSVFKAINIHQGPPMVANGLLAWKLKNNWR